MRKILSILFCLVAVTQLMSENVSWSFPPDTLSTVNVSASDPRIAIDSSGNAVAVWVENGFVKSKSKLVNMSWSASPSTLSNSGASSPCVVSDANGNATAVWIENGAVKAASKPLNGSWSTPVSLQTSGGASPDLAVDSSGNVVAVWAKSNDNVESSIKLFSGNWQTRVVINSTGATMPRVAIGGSSSRAVVVWQGLSGTTKTVYASSRLISGSWSAQVALSEAGINSVGPSVAVDSSGNASAVWFRYDLTGSVYENVLVQSATSLLNSAWSSRSTLSNPGLFNPANLIARIAYDGLGNAIAIWNTSYDNETFSIESAIKPVHGQWAASTELFNQNLYSYNLDLSVGPLGDAMAFYMFYNGLSLIIQSSELDITGFTQDPWSVPTNVAAGDKNSKPDSAMAVAGNTIHVAGIWMNSNGTTNSIKASTGVKALTTPPTGLSVVQCNRSFGVFTEYYNTLSWTASTDPNVVGYLIYRNGVFLAQVDASVTSIEDNNRAQSESVTYGISAINAEQSHGQIVSISFP